MLKGFICFFIKKALRTQSLSPLEFVFTFTPRVCVHFHPSSWCSLSPLELVFTFTHQVGVHFHPSSWCSLSPLKLVFTFILFNLFLGIKCHEAVEVKSVIFFFSFELITFQ